MSRFTCASLLFLSAVSPVAADGLVFALPEDRTAAVYEMELAFEQAGKKIIRPGSVKLAPWAAPKSRGSSSAGWK
jgi:hypothetical protein